MSSQHLCCCISLLLLLALFVSSSHQHQQDNEGPICNGYNYRLRTNSTHRSDTHLGIPDSTRIINKHCIHHAQKYSTEDVCHVKTKILSEYYVVCMSKVENVHNHDEFGCTENSNGHSTVPECFVCCPKLAIQPKFDQTVKVEYALQSLDSLNRGLFAVTNTMLLYDTFIDPLPYAVRNMTYAVKLKHEVYFTLRSLYKLYNIWMNGHSIGYENKLAVKYWLTALRGSMLATHIKLGWVKFYDRFSDALISKIRLAIRVAVLPIRFILCGMHVLDLFAYLNRGELDLLKAYVVGTSCLRTTSLWFHYVNDIKYTSI